jgi:transcriptional regulator with XRE-family HTH domain
MRQGPKVGSGKTGPYIRLGRVLTERRETMPGIPDRERSQNRFAKRLGVSQSFLGQVERGEKNLANYSPEWFERYAPHYGWTRDDMLEALELRLVDGKVRPARSTESSAIPREERTVLFHRVPYHTDGTTPLERSSSPMGEAWLEDDGFLENHPNGYYFRIADASMEPHFPESWLAAIVPDPKLAQPRSPVLVWLSSGSRVVRYLVQREPDGTLVLYQPNPPVGERRVVIAPTGSRVLGVVVDAKREIEPSRVPRLSSREIASVLAEEMPELLETVEF